MRWLFKIVALSALLGTACTSGGPTGSRPQGDSPNRASSTPKILTVAVNEDPKNWWEGVNGGGGGGSRELSHFVNQYLASIGPDGTATPRLLAELPSIQSGTWRVSPDGTMETTYKLRSDAKWHDGTP